MRGGLWLLIGSILLTSGCFLLRKDARTVLSRPIEKDAPLPPGTIVVEHRLIDQPAGDPFLADSLWTVTRNPLDARRTALLEENGLRVGIASGILPPAILERLSSERHVVNPRAELIRSRDAKIIPVNGPLSTADATVLHDLGSARTPLPLSEAELGFRVRAEPRDSGRIRLFLEPTIQHGPKESWLRPNGDETQLIWDHQRPQHPLPTLAMEFDLDPGDYLILGSTEQIEGTLGELYFLAREPARLRQRVLVIRARSDDTPGAPPSRVSVARMAVASP